MTRTHISILSLKFLFCPFRLHRKTFPAPEKAPLEEILEVRLKQLDLDDGHGITMSWLCQAMEILSMTYTKATAMVPNSNVPEKWFHSFLENSLELLDLCNSISSTLSRLQNKCLSIKHALHLIDHQISNFQSLENLNGAHKALLQWMLRPPRKSRTCQSSTHPQKCPPLSKSLHAQTLYIVETITHFFTRGVAASLLASGVVLEELGQFFGGSGVICKEMANISSRSGVVLEELGQFLDRSGVVLEE
ncbi:UPF0496 protein 4-like [Amborella trichopoda]|uniref:Uncharacterized protein n=1 Tax=Amborella trichopoda TaxID=13333 RepID=W1PHK9_AMBTC|nr:UPF0496 protein 4-like [Amborella trichopoda]ERN09487.1 hypothetical protein AMTR_s00029p00110690 [Amborella trichopoda]|eukprot:XP_020525116.1 UPF0496 protein 4-like [Amborella trichopoda]